MLRSIPVEMSRNGSDTGVHGAAMTLQNAANQMALATIYILYYKSLTCAVSG